jgi:serine/threonine protein kinase
MTDELALGDLGTLGRQIGEGGQATVHLVPELRLPDATGDLVFKRYKGNQAAPNGLRAIVRVRSRMDVSTRGRLDQVAAWPARVVREGDAVVGVVMPLIPPSFFQERVKPSGKAANSPREVQNLFVAEKLTRRVGMPVPTMAERFAMCRDLAGALAFLHEQQIVFGDINAKNALFRMAPEPTVMLVDCDAVRIRGSAPVVRQLNAPDWSPPEGSVLTQATDVYKFGLFVIRMLSPGPQASTSRSPERIAGLLDQAGKHLLSATLALDGRSRPPASAWHRYFIRTTPVRRGEAVMALERLVPAVPKQSTTAWRRDPGTGKWIPV